MNRTLIRTQAFVRAARRLVKSRPDAAPGLALALERLARDASDPLLRTHKLKGTLDGFWACSVGSDLRIVFSFVMHEGLEAILLQTVGDHDAVY